MCMKRCFSSPRNYKAVPEEEDYLIHITTGTHVAQICLFLLAESRHLPGKLLQCEPPKGRKASKGNPGKFTVIDLDLERYDRLATRFAEEHAEARSFLKEGIATKNVAFNQMIERIEQVALCSTEPMLLMGPTGAGKSRLARRIYELRQNRTGLEGELCGDHLCDTSWRHGGIHALRTQARRLHRRAERPAGAAPGSGRRTPVSRRNRRNWARTSRAMLLRALEDKTFFPVGSDKPARSQFQLIAGTNRDLREAVAQKAFREDLFARINLWSFYLPSLSDRREDIGPNVEYELEKAGRALGKAVTFNKEALGRFLGFAMIRLPPGGGISAISMRPSRAWRASLRRGRIRRSDVDEEIARLEANWQRPTEGMNHPSLIELESVLTDSQDQSHRPIRPAPTGPRDRNLPGIPLPIGSRSGSLFRIAGSQDKAERRRPTSKVPEAI